MVSVYLYFKALIKGKKKIPSTGLDNIRILDGELSWTDNW